MHIKFLIELPCYFSKTYFIISHKRFLTVNVNQGHYVYVIETFFILTYHKKECYNHNLIQKYDSLN